MLVSKKRKRKKEKMLDWVLSGNRIRRWPI